MAGLEALTSIVYHERQAPGSMLCAQHALNVLLQGNYFSAPDLANIAMDLDSLERESLHEEGERVATSANMDDTGFFSVQVMENALAVWGLKLVRWRSEEMRPYQNMPHTQLGFILNLEQHWFTLRRFGPAMADIDKDPGEGHWYNLNSTLRSPEWVSRTYLGMFLQQAEEDGYSVFVVRQGDPKGPLALPRIEADTIATTLDARGSDRLQAPTVGALQPFAKRQLFAPADTSSVYVNSPGSGRTTPINDVEYVGAEEDEDWELQAALQASLSQSRAEDDITAEGQPAAGSSSNPGFGPSVSNAPLDPVEASLARHKHIMNAARRQQEMALRGTYEEEMARFTAPKTYPSGVQDIEEGAIEDDPMGSAPALPPRNLHDRVYDDEDAELQAALKASLDTLPEGFVMPESPSSRPSGSGKGKNVVRPLPESDEILPQMAGGSVPQPVAADKTEEEDMEAEDTNMASSPPAPPKELDKDEMRRLRLAKFGA